MKNNLFTPVIILLISLALATCSKHEGYLETGGLLPTNYVTFQANGSFSPVTLRVASGSSITFVNNDTKTHNILSTDSTIYTNLIAPGASYFFKNDTAIGTFSYRCTLDSAIRGTIIITP
jgi:plastocyanin